MSNVEKSNIWRERGNQPEKYMREPLENQAETAIKTANKETTGPLTQDTYDSWVAETDARHPSSNQIVRGLEGTWTSICQSFGVKTGRYNKYSRYERILAIKKAYRDTTGTLTVEAYREWRNEQPDPTPSSTRITELTGGWQLSKLIFTPALTDN